MWTVSKGAVVTLIALSAIGLTSGADDPTGSLDGVQDLTPDNFDKFVNGGKHALVEFYAPWCGHCKHLTPEYKKLGAAILADGRLKNRVVIAKVNADEHRSIGERFGVQGFPTLKWFGRGKSVDKPDDYQGARKADDFLSFIEQKLTEDKGFARVESLDEFARLFKDAPDLSTVFKQLSDKASGLVDDTEKTAGEIYVKYGKKSVEKGISYFQSEYDRLERLLESGNVGGSKAGEISKKLSVLGAFLEGKDVEAS